jgi:hypothetical protein
LGAAVNIVTRVRRLGARLAGHKAGMGIKDELHKVIDNAADALSEAGHKLNANTEQATRDAAGDEMTAGEKAKSILNQGKEDVLAGVDHAKQDVRNNT